MKKLIQLSVGLVLVVITTLSNAEVLLGRVVGVSDGDTITVLDDTKQRHVIRLMGIDAPEKTQPFGQKAKQSLSDLIFDRDVSVTWYQKDRYGRKVGQVHVGYIDVCLEQIKRGLAWHYKDYERQQTIEDRLRYSEAEQTAINDKVGLWIDEQAIEPSKFRRGVR